MSKDCKIALILVPIEFLFIVGVWWWLSESSMERAKNAFRSPQTWGAKGELKAKAFGKIVRED